MKDFARLNVYIADSNVIITQEMEDYSSTQLVSDIGGQLGLWVGISIITLAEVCEGMLEHGDSTSDRCLLIMAGPFIKTEIMTLSCFAIICFAVNKHCICTHKSITGVTKDNLAWSYVSVLEKTSVGFISNKLFIENSPWVLFMRSCLEN